MWDYFVDFDVVVMAIQPHLKGNITPFYKTSNSLTNVSMGPLCWWFLIRFFRDSISESVYIFTQKTQDIIFLTFILPNPQQHTSYKYLRELGMRDIC